MSDLVGDPEDRFSQNEAHINIGVFYKHCSESVPFIFVSS